MSQGVGIYKKNFSLAVEAGFYSDMVECLPVDPATWVWLFVYCYSHCGSL